ncbi:MAG TPA: ribonuclease HII [Alphaproteobacteria bacterium]|nr:ribonuclease HII [Alphaproteobacteria bacterium]
MPDFSFERRATGLVAGIDEAGRGPWAGPVVAAAVILGHDEAARRKLKRRLAGLDDSKRLPVEAREVYVGILEEGARRGLLRYGIAAASVYEIDRFNILAATHIAMARALAGLGLMPELALVDGDRAPRLPCPVECIVGGDGLSLSIAAASVLAKVTRDRLMRRLAPRYPGFGWEHNMGYGTEEHREALWRLGITCHHRRSFAPVSAQQGTLSL